MAQSVTIRRDAYGVPHIEGPTDASVVFGFAYAQAEDYFWQIEDTYLLCLGRYAEAHGPSGLNSDLLSRAFEIVPRSRADFPGLEPSLRSLCQAYTDGLNFFLETHPHFAPRLIKRFEPWYVLAFGRHLTLELTFRYTRLTDSYMPRVNPSIDAAVGSNAWALAPSRTRSGHAMLFANPHQPWFGFGQFYEVHLQSGEGWNFSGATFFGSPMPSLGHNEDAGWTFTVNEPDIADVWRETFDDPQQPLNYRYGDGYRTAVEWQETIPVKSAHGMQDRVCTFRKTHHGPVVAKPDDQHRLTVRIAKLYESLLLRQTALLVRARTLADFQRAMATQNFPIMNAIYADRQGNIHYLYNGSIPRRDPQFDWSQPVDGSDPRTEWQGYHEYHELPQVTNPPAGFVQNCNSTPFTTSDDGNPREDDFPAYMIEDRKDDKRRAKISRQLLREMHDQTFEGLQAAAFDTTLYWAKTELPEYERAWRELEKTDPDLARQVAPYLTHLLNWDFRCELDSTQATLCVVWYEELYGAGYPGESLLPRFENDVSLRFQALILAAARLSAMYGDWKVPWGEIHRIQRHANVADLINVPFDDDQVSLPCAGCHGPLGVIFTQYYTPTVNIPFLKSPKKKYGVIGYTFLGVYEFGERVRGATLLQFGASGDPSSEHYFDQARLLSERRLKPELFYPQDVLANTVRTYHPGDNPAAIGLAPAN